MANLSTLDLILLGTPQVHLNGTPVTSFISDKARALLYYLAATEEEQQRSVLAVLFWPEMPMDQALKNLRQALHNLQKLVSPHLLITRQTVAFDQSYPLTIDLAEVRRLLAEGTKPALQRAIDQATGELLAGFSLSDAPEFAAWLTEERAYLQQQLADGVVTLAHHALQAGQWTEAIPLLRQWLRWEPWQEEVGQWLMAAQARSGEYNGALRTFVTLQQQLRQELDVDPDDATLALRARILEARTRQRDGGFDVPVTAIGREVLLAEIRRHIARHLRPSPQAEDERSRAHGAQRALNTTRHGQLLTITGLGGMGKTHLARAVAYEHRHTFFDGIWWVALAPHATLEAALTAIAQVLQVDLRAGTDPATQITHLLHTQEALLILDNGEQLPQEALRNFIKALLAAAPHLTVLLTSRLPLGLPQETIAPLAGIVEQAASEQIFRQTAARIGLLTGTEDEARAITRICSLVDGMPLAIQLAAGLTDLHSCEEIAAHLSANPDALQTAQQDVPARQRSIRALLAATWSERTTTERRALTKLTIFAGSFRRAAARQVAQLSTAEIDHLCDLALLQRDGMRLTIHELLRQYIQEQQMDTLEPAAQRALHRQFQQYMLTLVAEQAPVLATAQAVTAAATLAEELANVQQAWRLAAATQALDLLAGAWKPLATFYRRRGPFGEGAMLLQEAAEVLQTAPHPDKRQATTTHPPATYPPETQYPLATPLICCLQTAAADLHLLAGNFESALQLARNSLALADAQGCNWALVDARLKESHALRALGRLPEARRATEQATAAIASLNDNIPAGDPWEETVRTRAELQLDLALEQGQLAIDLGNVTAAAEALERALALAHEQESETCESLAACELGYVYMALAKYTEADTHLHQALRIARNWADTRQESQVLARQARLYRECGDSRQWRASVEAALTLCRRLGDLVGEARSLNELGIYHRQQGDYGQAQHCFTETLGLLRRKNDRPFETLVLQNLGALELICGHYQEAAAHLQRACTLCDELAGIDMQCVLRVYLSWHAAEVGEGAQALTYAEEALTLAQATGRPAFQVFVHVALGGAHLALGAWEAAQHAFLQAQQHRRTISEEPLYPALSGQAYAAWQLGDRGTALALTTTVIDAPWAAVAQQTDTPFYIYWRCYQILAAYADERASPLLARVNDHLQAQLARIGDPALRHAFAENVPAHRQLLRNADIYPRG